jgi:hypothetical protein
METVREVRDEVQRGVETLFDEIEEMRPTGRMPGHFHSACLTRFPVCFGLKYRGSNS